MGWRKRAQDILPTAIRSWLLGEPEVERETYRQRRAATKQRFDGFRERLSDAHLPRFPGRFAGVVGDHGEPQRAKVVRVEREHVLDVALVSEHGGHVIDE